MMNANFQKIAYAGLAVAVVGGGWFFFGRHGNAHGNPHGTASAALKPATAPALTLVAERKDTLRFVSSASIGQLGMRTAEVKPAPSLLPLRLPGSLFLDPNRLVRVHSRFSGEVVSIGVPEGETKRTLRYGDTVKKGQVLATIWSKEVGEKKSELVEALSRLEVNKALLKKQEDVEKGIVSERAIFESRRTVQGDMIDVARCERTLRSWRLNEDEIEAVRKEVRVIQERNGLRGTSEVERKWAETEVRAAIDGVIVEKNFNVGDIIDAQADLFKIADLSRMQVLADVYEEDLPALRALAPEKRTWNVTLKSEEEGPGLAGTFDLIGSVIDPMQRTGVVMGWIENTDGRLAVGQFITAIVQLPPPPGLVAVPTRALIEEGDLTAVFVESQGGGGTEFSRRKVAVVRRGGDVVLVRSAPNEMESKKGMQSLKAGERVVVAGALQLGGELLNLQSLTASN